MKEQCKDCKATARQTIMHACAAMKPQRYWIHLGGDTVCKIKYSHLLPVNIRLAVKGVIISISTRLAIDHLVWFLVFTSLKS